MRQGRRGSGLPGICAVRGGHASIKYRQPASFVCISRSPVVAIVNYCRALRRRVPQPADRTLGHIPGAGHHTSRAAGQNQRDRSQLGGYPFVFLTLHSIPVVGRLDNVFSHLHMRAQVNNMGDMTGPLTVQTVSVAQVAGGSSQYAVQLPAFSAALMVLKRLVV